MNDIIIIIAQVLFVLVSLLISFAILLQEGKGGGLSALAGGSSQQIIGTSNPLRRLTVILSIGFFGLAAILAVTMSGRGPESSAAKKKPALSAPDKEKIDGEERKKSDQ